MSEQYPAQPAAQPRKITHPLNLAALADGPHAIDPGNTELIKAVLLRRLETTRRGAYPQTTAKQGENLYASAAPACTPVPDDEDTAAARLAFRFKDSTATETADLRAPDTIILKPTSHMPAILDWLRKSPLSAANKLARIAPMLLVALAGAFGPVADDLDFDNDDDDDAEECPAPRFHRHSALRFTLYASRTRNASTAC